MLLVSNMVILHVCRCVLPLQLDGFQQTELPFTRMHCVLAGVFWRESGARAGSHCSNFHTHKSGDFILALEHLLFSLLLGCWCEGLTLPPALLFLSQSHLSRWAYLPVISPTFFRKRFLFFFLGKRLLFMLHTGGGEGEKHLYGWAVQKIILQHPPCWQPPDSLNLMTQLGGWYFLWSFGLPFSF